MTCSIAEVRNFLEVFHQKYLSEKAALAEQFDDADDWFESVRDAALKGNLASTGLIPKTPAKKRGVLGTINESGGGASFLDAPEETEPATKKPNASQKKSKRSESKRKQTLSSDEDVTYEIEDDGSTKRRKTADKDEVIQVNDTAEEVDGGTGTAPQSQTDGAERRTRIERTTYVKETRETIVVEKANTRSSSQPPTLQLPDSRETFVIEKSETRSSRQPPTLRVPSPIRTPSPEPSGVFKSPRPMKQLSVLSDSAESSTTVEVVETAAPPLRMTRTKTRAMAKAAQKEAPKDVPKTPPPENLSESEQDSETTVTSVASTISRPVASNFKQKSCTPLGKTNYLAHVGTPNTSNVITNLQSFIQRPAPASVKKDRQEDYLLKITQKTVDASKKREEMIKAQTEEKIKKRQEKVSKVNAAREAIEKERADKLRQQLMLEEERLEAKRRKLAQQKAAEAAEAARHAKRMQEEEQRRLAEEKRREMEEQKRLAEEKRRENELRLAEERKREEEERRRLAEEKRRELEEKKRMAERKKQLEEQRRLARAQEEAERRRKEQEEAERRRKEQEEAERRKREAEKAAAAKAKAAAAAAAAAAATSQLNETYVKPLDETYVKPADETFVQPQSSTSYDMTPMPEERKPAPPKSADDYGIDDANCDDSSDEESNPKKEIPQWALGCNRLPVLASQYYIRHRQVAAFFGSKKSTPDLSKIFRKIDKKMLIRKSSAVWRTPPVKFNESIM